MKGRTVLVMLGCAFLFRTPLLVAQPADEVATYRSEDGGASWTRSGSGLPRHSRVNAFSSLKGILFAATDNGIFSSRDAGEHWQLSNEEHPFTARPLNLAALGETLFAGTDGKGVMASTDQGKTWHTSNEGLNGSTIRSLLVVRGEILAGTDRDGVFKSTDGGKTWSDYGQGLPAAAQVHQMATLGETVFAALYSKGLFRRSADEAAWRRVGRVVPLALATVRGTLIAGHNPGGIHWSSDQGRDWNNAGSTSDVNVLLGEIDGKDALSLKAPVWALSSNSHRAFAGAADGIFYTADAGRTWIRAEGGLPAQSPGVAFLANDGVVLATALVKP